MPRPGLLDTLSRQSHRPIGERIDFTNTYHPWLEGKPLVHGKKMKSSGGTLQ